MKIIRILIASFLLLSVIPFEAFCKDAHCIEETGHAEVTCDHALTHPATIMSVSVIDPIFQDTVVFHPYQRGYEDPILSLLIKPPIAAR